jgi:hypothetical protein
MINFNVMVTTGSVVWSPSQQVASCATTQEIPNTLWNLPFMLDSLLISVMNLIVLQSSPTSSHLSNILLNTLSRTASAYVPLLMLETMFHTHTESKATL